MAKQLIKDIPALQAFDNLTQRERKVAMSFLCIRGPASLRLEKDTLVKVNVVEAYWDHTQQCAVLSVDIETTRGLRSINFDIDPINLSAKIRNAGNDYWLERLSTNPEVSIKLSFTPRITKIH